MKHVAQTEVILRFQVLFQSVAVQADIIKAQLTVLLAVQAEVEAT
jgi:hypothetical protein